MSGALRLDKLLREEGFDTEEALERARQVLVDARLTRPGKEGIAAEKLSAVREALGAALFRTCNHPDCLAMGDKAGRRGRPSIEVSPASCAVCGGSPNRRAVMATADRLLDRGVTRVLVVGGTPHLHAELAQLFGAAGLQLRCVDGATGTHTLKEAATHLRWAQAALVWGSTPLPHKVSKLYTDDPPAGVRVIQVARRGIEALCQELRKSFSQ